MVFVEGGFCNLLMHACGRLAFFDIQGIYQTYLKKKLVTINWHIDKVVIRSCGWIYFWFCIFGGGETEFREIYLKSVVEMCVKAISLEKMFVFLFLVSLIRIFE